MASFTQIPLLNLLEGKMRYLGARQKVIAENVANADTPGFTPKDMKPFDQVLAAQKTQTSGAMASTDPNHLQAGHSVAKGLPQPIDSPDSETRMDGNSVVLEEEMMKMTEARTDYDTAVTLYMQSLNMIRTAAKKPGA
jgi:flagellar basal-body rod protein FlgB